MSNIKNAKETINSTCTDDELIDFLETVAEELKRRNRLPIRQQQLRRELEDYQYEVDRNNELLNSVVYRQDKNPKQNP